MIKLENKYLKVSDIKSIENINDDILNNVSDLFTRLSNFESSQINVLLQIFLNNDYKNEALTRYLIGSEDNKIKNSLYVILYDEIRKFIMKNNIIAISDDYKNLFNETENIEGNFDNESKDFNVNNIKEEDLKINEAVYLNSRNKNNQDYSRTKIKDYNKVQFIKILDDIINNNQNLIEKFLKNTYSKILLPYQNNEDGNGYPWPMTF